MKPEDIVVGMTVVCPHSRQSGIQNGVFWSPMMNPLVGKPLNVTAIRPDSVACVAVGEQSDWTYAFEWLQPYTYRIGDVVRVLPAPDRPDSESVIHGGSTWGEKKQLVGTEHVVERTFTGREDFVVDFAGFSWPHAWVQLVKQGPVTEGRTRDYGHQAALETRLVALESGPRAAEWGSFKKDVQERLKGLEETFRGPNSAHARCDSNAERSTTLERQVATLEKKAAGDDARLKKIESILTPDKQGRLTNFGLNEAYERLEPRLAKLEAGHVDHPVHGLVAKIYESAAREHEANKVALNVWQTGIQNQVAHLEQRLGAPSPGILSLESRLAVLEGSVARVQTEAKRLDHSDALDFLGKAVLDLQDRLAALDRRLAVFETPKPSRFWYGWRVALAAVRALPLLLARPLARLGGGRLESVRGKLEVRAGTSTGGGSIVFATADCAGSEPAPRRWPRRLAMTIVALVLWFGPPAYIAWAASRAQRPAAPETVAPVATRSWF